MSTPPQPVRTALSSLSGYLEALKAGDVVKQEYIDRLNQHYIKKLEDAIGQQPTPSAWERVIAALEDEKLGPASLPENKQYNEGLDDGIRTAIDIIRQEQRAHLSRVSATQATRAAES